MKVGLCWTGEYLGYKEDVASVAAVGKRLILYNWYIKCLILLTKISLWLTRKFNISLLALSFLTSVTIIVDSNEFVVGSTAHSCQLRDLMPVLLHSASFNARPAIAAHILKFLEKDSAIEGNSNVSSIPPPNFLQLGEDIRTAGREKFVMRTHLPEPLRITLRTFPLD